MACHASCVARRTSYVTRRTSHVTRHTSHVTRHTSHITRHAGQLLPLPLAELERQYWAAIASNDSSIAVEYVCCVLQCWCASAKV